MNMKTIFPVFLMALLVLPMTSLGASVSGGGETIITGGTAPAH